jgi:endonuclease III
MQIHGHPNVWPLFYLHYEFHQLMPANTNWVKAIQPLLKAYKGKKHPLEYGNTYQLLIMVILAAQDSDRNINKIAPEFFKTFPNMSSLAQQTPEMVMQKISKVRNFRNKSNWIVGIAKQVKKDSNIPLTLEELVQLPGIGRKSANVILRESGKPAEGVMVDLHTVRVAPRLGIVDTSDPKKIEQELMTILPQKYWDAGMAMSFHGREICRPKPMCEICFMKDVCNYYNAVIRKSPKGKKA